MKLLVVGFLGLLGSVAEGPSGPAPGSESTLYFFFSPDSPGQEELCRRVVHYTIENKGAVHLRSVLLVEDFGALGRIKEQSPFTRSLKELSRLSPGPLDLGIYDEEGLALARAWKICRLPAIVLARDGRAHLATGSRSKPEDLEECR